MLLHTVQHLGLLEQHLAFGRLDFPAQGVEKGRFACTVRADQEAKFTLPNGKINTGNGFKAIKINFEPFRLDNRLSSVCCCRLRWCLPLVIRCSCAHSMPSFLP